MPEPERDPKLETLLAFIRDERGFDFTGYKRPSLARRIEKRMQDVGLDDYGGYQKYLEQHQEEFSHLFNTILINVTAFFRDEVAWDFLATEVVPAILSSSQDETIRVWSTGCATGEEAYTAAIVLAEAIGEEAFRARVKIYATDIDEDALSVGRQATYAPKVVEHIPEPLREKYFDLRNGEFAFRKDLRRAVIFGRHDLLQDPPISKVDLLLSRNTLMYFGQEAQTHILRQFHFAIRNSGFLFLGKAEAIANRSELFAPVDLKRKVFTRVPLEPRVQRVAPEDGDLDLDELAGLAHASLMREVGFETAPLAQIVVDREGRLALANLQARMFFSLTPRDIGRPLQDLEVSYRPVELRSRIDQAYADRHTITLRDVEWRVGDDLHYVDVQVAPLLAGAGEFVGCGVTFSDVTRYQRLQQALAEAKNEADTASEELQSTVEELETTNEELQSTNEELETTNEELQSTNEELETMNEELQSTNEELSTINDELQMRTDELNETNAFLESILRSLGSAVLVVNRELQIQRWNTEARDLWGLTEDEVRGSHLLNLDIGLPVDQLRTRIKAVFNGESTDGELMIPAVNRRGRPIECRVQFSPLDGSGQVTGVIVLMEPTEAVA